MAGIQITLAGNFSKLDELKNKTQRTAASIKSAFASDIGKKAFAGLSVAAGAAFTTIIAGMKSAIEAGGELSDVVAKTGAKGRDLLILGQAFKNAGLSADQVGDAVARMQKALAGVNEEGEPTNAAFAKLNLSVAELMAMDPAAALMRTGEAIASIEDPALRTAAAMEIFGRSGANLNVVFTDGAAFATAETQLGALADLLPEMAGDADFVADAFGSIDVKLQQLGAGVASQLMPELKQLSEWLNETDFTGAGNRIGGLAGKIADFYGAIYGNRYLLRGFDKLFGTGGKAPTAAPEEPTFSIRDEGAAYNPFAEDRKKLIEERQKAEAKEAEKAATAAERKAAAAAESAAKAEVTRSAAAEEWKLEMAILSAKIAGDEKHLAALEREKRIQAEIRQLESAGFTAAEARRPAAQKVDAEIAEAERTAKMEAADKAAEEKRKAVDAAQGAVDEARGRLDAHQFQSSIGAISSMQRIGGGGGAVASGLDYARQTSDLLRELNGRVAELVNIQRREVEV